MSKLKQPISRLGSKPVTLGRATCESSWALAAAKRLGVRWLAGNGADTALATDPRANPPHGKALSRKKAQKGCQSRVFHPTTSSG